MRPSELQKLARQIASGTHPLTYRVLAGMSVYEADKLVAAYVDYLKRRSPYERLELYRADRMTTCERWIWARRFPDEVPLVNDEFEWIALWLADRDRD